MLKSKLPLLTLLLFALTTSLFAASHPGSPGIISVETKNSTLVDSTGGDDHRLVLNNHRNFVLSLPVDIASVARIKLIDFRGGLIYCEEQTISVGQSKLSFTLEDLPHGSYYLEVSTETFKVGKQLVLR